MPESAQGPRFFNDAASALSVRVGIIFNNLRVARDDRPRHVEKCVSALLETLVAHDKDISDNELLIDVLYQHLSQLLDISLKKGVEAFRVVFDIGIGDPHDKRARCINLLTSHVARAQQEEVCATLLDEFAEVLKENTRSTTDLIVAPFERAVSLAHDGKSAVEKAIGCQSLVKMIVSCSSIIKRTPSLLESLTSLLTPQFLLHEVLGGTATWHQRMVVKLLVEVINNGCFDITSTVAAQITSIVVEHMELLFEERRMLGILELLQGVMECPNLQAIQWPLLSMADFLTKKDKVRAIPGVQVALARTIGVCLRLFQSNSLAYDQLATYLKQSFSSSDAIITFSTVEAVEQFLQTDELKLRQPVKVAEGMCSIISRLPFNQHVFEVLKLLRQNYGEESVACAYALAEKSVKDTTNIDYLQLSALIEFSGSRSPVVVEWAKRLKVDIAPDSDPNYLTRALPLLATLGRTNQVKDILRCAFHENVDVRKAAVKCMVSVCLLLIGSSTYEDAQGGLTRRLDSTVTAAVEKLLDVAVADRNPELRCLALQLLAPPFDVYLAMPDNLEALFMCYNDSCEAARNEALVLLCRLHPWHPGIVHPQLLRFQEYMLGEIETKDGSFTSAIAHADVLRLTVENKTLLLTPKAVESVALSRLSKKPFLSKRLSIALLRLIEAVLNTSGPNNHCEVRKFIKPILTIINEGVTSQRRTVALNTLCSVLRTITVNDPTISTEIYRAIGRILRNESEEDYQVCLAASRLLSVIGAVNPVKLRKVIRAMEADEVEEKDAVATVLTQFKPRVRTGPHVVDRYPTVVLYLLVKVFQLSTDFRQQADALTTISTMLKDTPANNKVVLLTQFVPQLLVWLQEPEKAHIYEGILYILADMASLLRHFKDVIPPNMGTDILHALHQLCALPQASQKPLNAAVVRLLDDLARGLPAQELQDHRWGVEFILQGLSQDKSDLPLVLQVVRSLDSFSAILQEKDLQHVLPHVLQCIEPAFATPLNDRPKMREINVACFEFLNHTMMKQPALIKDCCAEIVHTIMWYIEDSDNKDEMEMGLSTLALLVEIVKRPAQRFVDPIQRIALQNGFVKDTFPRMLHSAAQGFLKVKVPANKQDRLSCEHPITVISHLPALTKRDFDSEMRSSLMIDESQYEVLSLSHNAGQTSIQFRFLQSADAEGHMRQFERKAQEALSSLRRNLGILRLEQNRTPKCALAQEFLDRIIAIPVANKRKREQSWVAWLHNTSISVLKNSPYQPLRTISGMASVNNELSRDIFPFSASAIIGQLDNAQRALIMTTFTKALEMSPYDIKQVLFAFAEYMESERGSKKSILVKSVKTVACTVERQSPDQKFGINYDQESRGIVVTKLAPNGPGARANVPVGATLQAINGEPVRSVNDIPAMIKGLNTINLTLSRVVEERQTLEPKALMNLDVLARVAFDSQMHAKAVYFNEVLFETLVRDVTEAANRKDVAVQRAVEVAERLIEFYDCLGLTMVAKGLVKSLSAKLSENIIAPEQFGFDEIGTLEQLNWWSDALARYSVKMVNTDETLDLPSFLGALRCYDALGETVMINSLIDRYWDTLEEEAQADVAPMRAKAALVLGDWKLFDSLCTVPAFTKKFGTIEFCTNLFREELYDDLLRFVQDKRAELFEPFCESFNEGYARSYDALIELQHLAHFEEIVSFVMSSDERRDMLKALWNRRITAMSSRPGDVRTAVTINSLVLRPEDDLQTQVVCVRVLTKQHWRPMAEHMLNRLIGTVTDVETLCHHDPDLINAYLKHHYSSKNKREAVATLKQVLTSVRVTPEDPNAEAWGRCWLQLGEWTMMMSADDGNEAIQQLIRATELAPKNFSTFHSLGILHYDLSRDVNASYEERTAHHVAAVTAFFKSVQLTSDTTNNSMQDVLRILSIWFAQNTDTNLNEAIHAGIEMLPPYLWLNVIPQLIARIGITARGARSILAELLVRVGSQYPHALIYPLTVAEKSPDNVRRVMAERVLSGIRVKNAKMVQEASLVSNEMVRIAILWSEKWHSGIQQAASQQEDATAILAILAPLYDELDSPTTPNERNFEKSFGQSLRRARTSLQNGSLDQAWAQLKQVYMQLAKIITERRLYMADVSPTLDGINKSIVAVPGTFVHGKPLITIQEFHSRVVVMPSKQKPRRFGLDASNGKKYRFLLKGHEDLRQDERVMQFFELINTIFASEASSSTIGLRIPQYSVIPLTDNVGIIGWVENTETIYKMLENRRQEYSISIYEEVNLIAKKGGLRNIDEYHRLPKQQRKSLLNYVMENSPSDELRRILWDKTDTCEQWLAYRNSYGNTLAIMSMVGYVLGLGDRHLNNLMLKEDGAVIHIDFGDCFEVAMHRSLYAEAVPFRLTRLLVAALGITGVDGVFRFTSELVMKLLRRHSENLLSILEAFIYDPLINWRLSNADADKAGMSRSESREKAGASSTNTNGNPNAQGTIANANDSTSGAAAGKGSNANSGGIQMPSVLTTGKQSSDIQQIQMSFSVAKWDRSSSRVSNSSATEHANPNNNDNLLQPDQEEETRNQQGDLALARVQAKLTGQDFGGISPTSFRLQSLHRGGDNMEDSENSSWSMSSVMYGDSPKDSFAGPALTTYLTGKALSGGVENLDVPSQVDRLIQEATSLDNLADAYITGWAPFW